MACFVSTRQQALHLLRIDPAAGSAPALYDCIDPATGPAPAPYGLLRIDPAIGPAPAPDRPGYRLGRPLLRIDPAAGSAPALYDSIDPATGPTPALYGLLRIDPATGPAPVSYRPGYQPGACSVSTLLP